MILVPLYYQQVRGESVIVTGLLVGPQGLGMLLVAPWIARMTDRFGGGRVAFVGVSILTLSSLPLAFIGADTSILFISLLLLVRGVGIGLSFIPTTTVAFASLRTDQLSDATPQMNVLQRVGGAIGTAVLAVVLQRASAGAARPGRAGRRLRHRLLVGARDLRRLDDPGARPAARRGAERGPPTRLTAEDRDGRGVRGADRCLRSPAATAERPRSGPSAPAAITELGIAFRRAFRSLRSLRGRDTHRGDEIGHAQFELLIELCVRGPLHAGELAEAVEASAATVSGMLDHLCAADLVERTRSETDRRIVVVKLTRRGKRKVEARKALWQAALAGGARGPRRRRTADRRPRPRADHGIFCEQQRDPCRLGGGVGAPRGVLGRSPSCHAPECAPRTTRPGVLARLAHAATRRLRTTR